jgi:hypothetical protein
MQPAAPAGNPGRAQPERALGKSSGTFRRMIASLPSGGPRGRAPPPSTGGIQTTDDNGYT